MGLNPGLSGNPEGLCASAPANGEEITAGMGRFVVGPSTRACTPKQCFFSFCIFLGCRCVLTTGQVCFQNHRSRRSCCVLLLRCPLAARARGLETFNVMQAHRQFCGSGILCLFGFDFYYFLRCWSSGASPSPPCTVLQTQLRSLLVPLALQISWRIFSSLSGCHAWHGLCFPDPGLNPATRRAFPAI